MGKNKNPMQSNRTNYKSGPNKLNTGNSFGLLEQVGDGATVMPIGRNIDNYNNNANANAFPKPKVGPGRPKADPLSKVSDPEVRSIFRT
mgnify:FL=1